MVSPDQARAELEATMGRIRDIGAMVEELGGQMPIFTSSVEAIRRELKNMIMQAAGAAGVMGPQGSTAAIPTAGTSMGGA